MAAKSTSVAGISYTRLSCVGLVLTLTLALSFPGIAATAGERDTNAGQQGPWQVRCLGGADKGQPERCEATLRITNRGAEIAELAFGRLENAQPLIVAGRAPLGVLLSDGMQLTSEKDDDPIRASYSTCLPSGCVAQTIVESARLSELLSGDRTHLSYREKSGRTVKILIPLQGLKEALGRMGVEMAG